MREMMSSFLRGFSRSILWHILKNVPKIVAGISNKEIKSNHKDKYDSYLKLKKLP
jgi:hypothetical protein